jgi:hypothetical protein
MVREARPGRVPSNQGASRVELAVPVAEFAAQPCRRCGEPMGAHGIRPLHVPELTGYVTAAELVCPTPDLEGR